MLYFQLNNEKFYNELFAFSASDWDLLAETIYSFAIAYDPLAFIGRTPSGISYEFSDHYFGYRTFGNVTLFNLGDHLRYADVGGLLDDSDGLVWELFKPVIFGRP